jgi:drug/metabolite transporter (DMT)-like permease
MVLFHLGALELGLIAMFCYGAYTIMLKRAFIGAANPGIALALIGLFFFVGGLFYASTKGSVTEQLPSGLPLVLILTAGVVGTIAILSYYEGLNTGRVSTVAPLFGLSFAVAVGLGILFLGDIPTKNHTLGIITAVVSVILLTH